jgi:quinohemoprotein amine dehydrogenase
MRRKTSSVLSCWIAAGTLACGTPAVPQLALGGSAQPGLVAVRTNCSGCHRESAPGHFDRISEQRKSPEGWAMTIFRMGQLHGLELTSQAQATIIQYLSDVQGLAPEETLAGRFALERRPNMQDLKLPDDLHGMCGHCHSLARVALQRRTAAEWLKLVNFHVGQWPTVEYQTRDIPWWEIATAQLPGKLADLFPLDSAAWQNWRDHPHASLEGNWVVQGHTPGRGDYYGTASIRRVAGDAYQAHYALHDSNGAAFNDSSDAIVYTGYQWRGTGTLDGKSVQEVYFASADGSQISGRWFLTDHAEIGGDWSATRIGGTSALMTMIPSALRTGTTRQVILVGKGLRGAVDLGPGTRSKVLARLPYGLVLGVSVDADAATGYRTVRVGGLRKSELLAIYRRVDRLEVEPAFAIARVGGGTLAPVDAQFEAIGYADVVGAHGEVSSVRLGAMPATWSVEPFNADAAKGGDSHFAGTLNQDGRFLPAEGGPDPKRRFLGDDIGNLFSVATYKEGTTDVAGKAHLIVTVQRWINPPIY